MRRDLGSELRRIAPDPIDDPDLPRIERSARWRRLRTRLTVQFGVVAILAGGFIVLADEPGQRVPNDMAVGPYRQDSPGGGPPIYQPDPMERAAVVALEALTRAGLHDEDDIYLDYGETTLEGDRRWRAHFCLEEASNGICAADTADSFVDIEADTAITFYEVVDMSAAISESRRAEVIGYRAPADGGASRMVHEPIHVSDTGFHGSAYWTGAIPSQLEAMCFFDALKEGAVVYTSREWPMSAPVVEGARDSVFSSGFTEDVEADSVRSRCSDWTPGVREEPSLPGGDRHVVLSGVFDEGEWGEYQGQSWELIAWADETGWCGTFEIGGAEGGVHCSMAGTGSGAEEHLGPFSYDPGAGEVQGFAYGEVSPEVETIEFQLDDGATIKIWSKEPPPGLDVDLKYFFTSLPGGADGRIAVFDAQGNELDARVLCHDPCG